MKRIVDVDMEIACKNFSTALNRFFKKYPELDYWRDSFKYMLENNEYHFSDEIMADGTYNKNWSYALNLDVEVNYFYIGVIERI